MSHPHTVPQGWTRGQPLTILGAGPQYALAQKLTAMADLDLLALDVKNGVAAIIFDCYNDLVEFTHWWYRRHVMASSANDICRCGMTRQEIEEKREPCTWYTT